MVEDGYKDETGYQKIFLNLARARWQTPVGLRFKAVKRKEQSAVNINFIVKMLVVKSSKSC